MIPCSDDQFYIRSSLDSHLFLLEAAPEPRPPFLSEESDPPPPPPPLPLPLPLPDSAAFLAPLFPVVPFKSMST